MSFFDEIPDVFLSKLRYLCNQSKLKVLSPDINNDLFYLLVTFAFTGITTTLEKNKKSHLRLRQRQKWLTCAVKRTTKALPAHEKFI